MEFITFIFNKLMNKKRKIYIFGSENAKCWLIGLSEWFDTWKAIMPGSIHCI